MLYKKTWGQREFSKFSQRHDKLTLPRKKQGNYPEIPIYALYNLAPTSQLQDPSTSSHENATTFSWDTISYQ